jgi:hypothetical protein
LTVALNIVVASKTTTSASKARVAFVPITRRSVLTPLMPSMPERKFAGASTICTPETCATGGGVGATDAGRIGTLVGEGEGVSVGAGVDVGGATAASTRGALVAVGSGISGVAVGGTTVAVGGTGVAVASGIWGAGGALSGVSVGGAGVEVGGTGVAEGGTGVGGMGVGGTGVGGGGDVGTAVGSVLRLGLQLGPSLRGLPEESPGCSQWSLGGTAPARAGKSSRRMDAIRASAAAMPARATRRRPCVMAEEASFNFPPVSAPSKGTRYMES